MSDSIQTMLLVAVASKAFATHNVGSGWCADTWSMHTRAYKPTNASRDEYFNTRCKVVPGIGDNNNDRMTGRSSWLSAEGIDDAVMADLSCSSLLGEFAHDTDARLTDNCMSLVKNLTAAFDAPFGHEIGRACDIMRLKVMEANLAKETRAEVAGLASLDKAECGNNCMSAAPATEGLRMPLRTAAELRFRTKYGVMGVTDMRASSMKKHGHDSKVQQAAGASSEYSELASCGSHSVDSDPHDNVGTPKLTFLQTLVVLCSLLYAGLVLGAMKMERDRARVRKPLQRQLQKHLPKGDNWRAEGNCLRVRGGTAWPNGDMLREAEEIDCYSTMQGVKDGPEPPLLLLPWADLQRCRPNLAILSNFAIMRPAVMLLAGVEALQEKAWAQRGYRAPFPWLANKNSRGRH